MIGMVMGYKEILDLLHLYLVLDRFIEYRECSCLISIDKDATVCF